MWLCVSLKKLQAAPLAAGEFVCVEHDSMTAPALPSADCSRLALHDWSPDTQKQAFIVHIKIEA